MAEDQEFKRLKQAWDAARTDDDRKHALISELFSHIQNLTIKLAEAERDLRDRKEVLDLKRTQLDRADKQLQDMKRLNDRHVFTMVVIDGDNMPFQDKLVKEGLAGGKKTASLLKQAVEDDIKSRLPSIARAQVIVRVYANLKGLAKKYKDILPDPVSFDDFVRGFNTVDAMCDFTDAGSGKECADEKIKAAFKFALGDVHCRQVFFGGAADNGYARMLDPYLEDQAACEQITLLAGPPFARELAEIKDRFRTASFDKVFRSQQLPTNVNLNNNRKPLFHITPPGTPMDMASLLDYATAATKHAASLHPATALPPAPAGVVLRNKKGQRVDARLSYSPADFSDLKDLKLCNSFHLVGKCYHGERGCYHWHGDRLKPPQREALRAIARQSPCANGLSCGDPDCFSGHRCLRDPCKTVNCWFGKEMHNVDTQIAK